MPHKYFKLPQGTVPVEDALKEALERWDRESPYPYALLKALVQRDQRESFTPSKFYGCDRSLFIKLNFDYAVDPGKAFARLRGTMFHSVLEDAADGEEVLAEVELSRSIEVDGEERVITGRADLIVPSQGLVADYKTTARLWHDYPKPADVGKLRLYAWMAQAHGWELTKGEIVYVEIGTGRLERCRVLLKPADEAWIRLRVQQILAVYAGEVPPVIDAEDDVWMCRYCDVSDLCTKLAEAMGDTPPALGTRKKAA